MTLSIRVRVTLWCACLLTAVIAALGVFLELQLRADLYATVEDEAAASARKITNAVFEEMHDSEDPAPENPTELAEDFADVSAASLPATGAAQVLDGQGRVVMAFGVMASRSSLIDQGTLTTVMRRGATTEQLSLGADGQDYVVHSNLLREGGRVLVVALSLERVDEAVERVLVLLLVAGPASVVAVTVISYFSARKALNPVERMTSDAAEIGTDRLQDRIAVPSSHDEIQRLGETLNAMLDRVERGVQDRHRLVADASHELRTPLAVMRAEFDVSLRADDLSAEAREVLESAREEVDRISRTVDNLLALAAADEGRLELLTAPTELRQAVEDAARPLRQLAAAKGVSLRVEGEPCMVQADRQRLELVVTNLVENAIKFTPPARTVHVRSWRRGGEAGVSVTDEGPGIPPEDRAHLFDRYYQAGPGRARAHGGSGLGLAISRDVVLAHGGRLWVEAAEDSGSTFSLALPAWRTLDDDEGHGIPAPANEDRGSRVDGSQAHPSRGRFSLGVTDTS